MVSLRGHLTRKILLLYVYLWMFFLIPLIAVCGSLTRLTMQKELNTTELSSSAVQHYSMLLCP